MYNTCQMKVITVDQARYLYNNNLNAIYILYNDNSESLVDDSNYIEAIKNNYSFGIEINEPASHKLADLYDSIVEKLRLAIIHDFDASYCLNNCKFHVATKDDKLVLVHTTNENVKDANLTQTELLFLQWFTKTFFVNV